MIMARSSFGICPIYSHGECSLWLRQQLSQVQFADAVKTEGLMDGLAMNLTTALQTNMDPFSR